MATQMTLACLSRPQNQMNRHKYERDLWGAEGVGGGEEVQEQM